MILGADGHGLGQVVQDSNHLGVEHPLDKEILAGHHAAHLVLEQAELVRHHVDGQDLEQVLQDVLSKVLHLLHASLTTVLVHDLADLA